MESKVYTKEERELFYQKNYEQLKSHMDDLEEFLKNDDSTLEIIKEMKRNLKAIDIYRN